MRTEETEKEGQEGRRTVNRMEERRKRSEKEKKTREQEK